MVWGRAAGYPPAMPDSLIPVDDIELRSYVAAPPAGDGPWPAVVVVHDALGLTDAAREHADLLAAAGYVAVVPDLYTRGGVFRCVQKVMKSLAARHGQAFDDIDAVRRWAVERQDTTGTVGVIGFCMGGGFCLALVDRGFDASAPNYGILPKDLDRILGAACPVVASYGARDRMIKRGTASKLEAALRTHDVPHDVKEYPDAGHSFMDKINVGPAIVLMRALGIGYHHASAEDAWGRILRFFSIYLSSETGEQ